MIEHNPNNTHSRWKAIKFVVKAIEIRLRFVAVLVGIGLLIGYWETIHNHWDKWTRPANVTAVGSNEEFFCPMHPNVIRPTLEADGSVPKCPICGMPLSKRKKGELPELPEGILSRVQLSPQRIHQAGIATVAVNYQPLAKELRTVGFVDYDESRLSQIVTRFKGYVEKLYVNKTFERVAKGAPLAEIYSPELYSASQELVLAHQGGLRDMVASSRQKLRLLGIGDGEIDAILRSGKADTLLVLRSPQAGHVIRKNVVEGASVGEGMTLFEVADLSAVWVETDVFEKDIAFLKTGQSIEATVEAYPGRVFKGRVSLVHPHLEVQTRTNRVRFELENPNHELRPGMYATVRIQMPVSEIEPFAAQIAERKRRPNGSDIGQLAAWQKNCPVTGLKLGSMGTPVSIVADSQDVLLCCEGCTDRMKAEPDLYLAKLAPPPDDAVLTVPQLSVIDTGTKKIVYVEREPGLFEGVEVILGPRTGDSYPVISGLLPGDRIASAGTFLIDAETRLNPAAGSAYFGASGSAHDHDHGHDHAPRPATRPAPASPPSPASPRPQESAPSASSAEPQEIRAEFLKEITKLPAADQNLAIAQKLCPVTKQPLGSMGVPIKTAVNGKPVFLCCKGCEGKPIRESNAAPPQRR